MARHIKANGTVKKVQPANGTEFSVDELKDFVGGYFEAIKLTSHDVMYLHEDGVGLQLPINAIATEVLHQHKPERAHNPICGDVIIASLQETGDEDNTLHVQTTPTNAACTECGKSPALEWNLYGMTGILCRDCLAKEVDNVNHTIKDTEW